MIYAKKYGPVVLTGLFSSGIIMIGGVYRRLIIQSEVYRNE